MKYLSLYIYRSSLLLNYQSCVYTHEHIFIVYVHKRYSTTESATIQLGADTPQEFEIIILGTGASEGIPRVSCLTNPYKICEVLTHSQHANTNQIAIIYLN